MNQILKNRILTATKIFISCLTLWFVFNSLDWKSAIGVISQIQVGWVLLALIVFWIAQIISSQRCVYIAKALGGELSLPLSIRAHFMGLWFNQVLPSSLGGDVVKLSALSKPLGTGLAFRSCVLDRLSGLIFLLTTLLLTIPLYFKVLPEQYMAETLLLFSGLSLGIIIVSAWASTYLRRYLTDGGWTMKISQIFADIWTLCKKPFLKQQAWTSGFVYFCGIVVYGLIAVSLNISVDLLEFFLLVPLVFLVALLPFSFAGWGIREVGAIWVFGLVGLDKVSSLAISIAYGLFLIASALPGVLYLLIPYRHKL